MSHPLGNATANLRRDRSTTIWPTRFEAFVWIVLVGLPSAVAAADWPQWRYDPGRGGITADQLPGTLHLQWSRQLAQPRPAWPASQPWLRYDVSYSPVAADGLLFVPSMVDDSLTAYNAADGKEVWRFTSDGPVRMAPIADQGRVYFASDDGYLYCLDARQGKLQWRVRGGPNDRRVLGNERLISTWPIRGGPVLADGVVYFSAGIWPFMGIFVHAVDAQSGKTLWTNSGEGATYTLQPHNSPAFSGFAPHGCFAVAGQTLVAAGGRTQPGCFDRRSGKLLHWEFGPKDSGAWDVAARGSWYNNGEQLLRLSDGKLAAGVAAALSDDRAVYGVDDGALVAWAAPAAAGKESTSSKIRRAVSSKSSASELWRAKLPGGTPKQLFLKAGEQWIFGGDGQVAAVSVDNQARSAKTAWKRALDGQPWSILAASGRLFVVTTSGRIDCFAAEQREPMVYRGPGSNSPSKPLPDGSGSPPRLASLAGKSGYGLVLGLSRLEHVEGLVQGTSLHVIGLDPDPAKVEAARRRAAELGCYGSRFAAHVGDPAEFALPPYFADVALVESGPDSKWIPAAFAALRPYGGTLLLPGAAKAEVERLVGEAKLDGARVESQAWGTALVRAGALPGAADWTHQYGDAANTVCSRDDRVKAPLGLLWFGGPPNDEVLPRHGHGPAPQVSQGRLFIEGADMLRALDIYTGRLLWQKAFPGLGTYYDNTEHQPGANEIGSNYACSDESVYVVRGESVLVLDAINGETRREISLKQPGEEGQNYGGFIAVCGDLLLVGTHPEKYASSSPRLLVFDRREGKLLWQRQARYTFRHNSIVAGKGTVFCIDSRSKSTLDRLKRYGEKLRGAEPYRPQLLALDAHTGSQRWATTDDVFGTFLGYSQEHDVLLEATSAARDRAEDEAECGMTAYRASDGKVLWKDLKRKYIGPCMLHHDTIIAQGKAFSLLTGEAKFREDPLTGAKIPWEFQRNYGCNTAIASQHLITFRSAAAGYYDLACDGGTGNFGGFKSSCTSNLIVAGGLLCAPEFTRTCTCRYQNQTSLAMIHDPAVETWTFNPWKWNGQPVRRVGINFGAPGDRLAENGTLWLDAPSLGGASPDVPVAIKPASAECFRHHSGLVRVAPGTGGLAWVAASGVRGVREVVVTLSNQHRAQPQRYTVSLHFLEDQDVQPGQRVFAVRLQEKQVAAAIDIAKEAGRMTACVKTFPGVEATDRLTIGLEPLAKDAAFGPVLCGVEIVAE